MVQQPATFAVKTVNHSVSQQISGESTKLDLAIRWLSEHKDDRNKSGRTLEAEVQVDGQKISYRTWLQAKKEI